MKNQTVTLSIPMFPIFLVLLVLKLTGTVMWPWWIITLPLWGPLAVIALIFLLIVIIGVLV